MAPIDFDKYKGQANGRGDFKRLPSLRAENLKPKGNNPVLITSEPREVQGSDGRDSLVMDVKLGKQEYALWLNAESVLASQVIDFMGKKKTWKGVTLPLFVAKGRYINCEV